MTEPPMPPPDEPAMPAAHAADVPLICDPAPGPRLMPGVLRGGKSMGLFWRKKAEPEIPPWLPKIRGLTPTIGLSNGRPFAVLVMCEDGSNPPRFATLSPEAARQLAADLNRCANRVSVSLRPNFINKVTSQ